MADGTGLYRETSPPSGNTYSFLWPATRVAAAVLDLLRLGAVAPQDADAAIDRLFPPYWSPVGPVPGGAAGLPGAGGACGLGLPGVLAPGFPCRLLCLCSCPWFSSLAFYLAASSRPVRANLP